MAKSKQMARGRSTVLLTRFDVQPLPALSRGPAYQRGDGAPNDEQ